MNSTRNNTYEHFQPCCYYKKKTAKMLSRSTRMLGILYVLKAIHAEHISMLKINKYDLACKIKCHFEKKNHFSQFIL